MVLAADDSLPGPASGPDVRPELFGFPFFYWYQFAWVPITALIVWFDYEELGEHRAETAPAFRSPVTDQP